jgi:DNA-binding transcriptional regulator YiaG
MNEFRNNEAYPDRQETMSFADIMIQFRGFLAFKRGLFVSRAKFGQLLGVAERTITDYETGKSKPTKARMVKIKMHMRDEGYLKWRIENKQEGQTDSNPGGSS